MPFTTVDESREFEGDKSSSQILRGGERECKKIEGFELSNSPVDYSQDQISGSTIAFTTTNGTLAIESCRNASHVFIGAFVNLGALCQQLVQRSKLALVCAGTNGKMTTEDMLFAGAVCHTIGKTLGCSIDNLAGNRQTQIAAQMWDSVSRQFSHGHSLCQELRNSRGGRNLVKLGMDHDIQIAADVDKFAIVPELDLTGGVIVG